MEYIDKEIEVSLSQQFTPVRQIFEDLIISEKLIDANLVCWVPHEVGSLVQLGTEDGLVEDMEDFLSELAPAGKWTKHDEEDERFRKNFFEHLRTKLVGHVSMTLIVKDEKLYIGQWQNLYFYSPVYKYKPKQKIFCRILKLN